MIVYRRLIQNVNFLLNPDLLNLDEEGKSYSFFRCFQG